MALEDYPHAFNPIVVLDPSTGDPARDVVVQLRATPDGTALPLGDTLGNPMAEIRTTDLGILPAHRTTVSMPYVFAGGSVSLQETSVALMNALPAAEAAKAAAEAAWQYIQDWESGGGSQPLSGQMIAVVWNGSWPANRPSPSPDVCYVAVGGPTAPSWLIENDLHLADLVVP